MNGKIKINYVSGPDQSAALGWAGPHSHVNSQPVLLSTAALNKANGLSSTQPLLRLGQEHRQGGGAAGGRVASNSQSRAKKKKSSHQQTAAGGGSAVLRHTAALQEPLSQGGNTAGFYSLDPNGRLGNAHRHSGVTTTTSTKSKKKKQ